MNGGAATLMMIMTIVLLITTIALVWTVANTSGFFEVSELNSVKSEFESCNDKIMETARTGSSNKCIFSISKGELIGKSDSINYKLVSSSKICDESSWILLNPEKNIWQECHISGNEIIFGLKWNSSYVDFEFEKIGNVEVRGGSGHIIEISRIGVSESGATLKLNIY
jgi:hypothetical protein